LVDPIFLLRSPFDGPAFFSEAPQQLLILFLFCEPKEVIIELAETLKDGSLLLVVLVVLGDVDNGVDDLHDEGSIVGIVFKLQDLSDHLATLLLMLVVEEITYFYA
jgi:hypothetical protein